MIVFNCPCVRLQCVSVCYVRRAGFLCLYAVVCNAGVDCLFRTVDVRLHLLKMNVTG